MAAYKVPQELLKLLEEQPQVKQWMMDKLKMTDMQHGAPAVSQLYPSPFQDVIEGPLVTAPSPCSYI